MSHHLFLEEATLWYLHFYLGPLNRYAVTISESMGQNETQYCQNGTQCPIPTTVQISWRHCLHRNDVFIVNCRHLTTGVYDGDTKEEQDNQSLYWASFRYRVFLLIPKISAVFCRLPSKKCSILRICLCSTTSRERAAWDSSAAETSSLGRHRSVIMLFSAKIIDRSITFLNSRIFPGHVYRRIQLIARSSI